MRVSACTLCSLLLLTFLPGLLQGQRPSMPKGDPVPIEKQLRKIERATKYRFIYPAGFFTKTMLIDGRVADARWTLAVDSFMNWLNVRWSLQGSIISIRDWKGPAPIYTPPTPVVDTSATFPGISTLDEVVNMPYQVTTQRHTTVTVYQLLASTLNNSAVNNPIGTIEARIPGAYIRQTNGVPGSALQIRLEGRHSIQQGNDPLIVVDGVPWATNGFLNPIGSSSAQGPLGASAFNGIPMTAIASISVMQGPAATALYGSRASNGVILITLKEGRSGTLNWTVDANGGITRTVRTSPLLNTSEFLSLREEATRNDGLPVNDTTVPERRWGAGRNGDFKRMTMGGTGVVQHAHVDLDWGNTRSWFLVSGRYYRESSVFPGDTHDQDVSLYGNWHYQSDNKRLRVGVSGMGNVEDIHLPRQDYSQFQFLAPNAWSFRDSNGDLNWGDANAPMVNIPAQTYNIYRGKVTTLLGHGDLSYELVPYLFVEGRVGYNGIFTRERSLLQVLGQAPFVLPPPVNDTTRADNHYNSGIFEGMVKYAGPLGPGRLDMLAGYTYQGQREEYSSYRTRVPTMRGPNTNTESILNRYQAIFGRATYVWKDQYVLSAALRRDGSSKFGPGYHYGTFWSVGGAWIFLPERAGALSFGKIKGSYGTTGNDQINPTIYDTATAKMLNNHLSWESNYRAELGLDLGFAGGKLLFSANLYRSWTKNQLIYGLPNRGVRGPVRFTLLPANVLNEGLEFLVQAVHVRFGRRLDWSSSLAITVPRNVLKSFPALDSSSLANTLVVGKSLSVTKEYHLTGVDPQTGYYTFRGISSTGVVDASAFAPGPSLDPKFFVGWGHTLSYGNFQLNVLLDWQRQNGMNPLAAIDQRNPAGFQNPSQLSNGPVEWLEHWRQAGDRSSRQRVSAGNDGQAFFALINYLQSDALVRDASYLRVKNIALSYKWSAEQLKRWPMVEGMSVFLRGEDLWTVSRFPVTDPETQDPYVLPPMRVVTVGFSISFKNKAGALK